MSRRRNRVAATVAVAAVVALWGVQAAAQGTPAPPGGERPPQESDEPEWKKLIEAGLDFGAYSDPFPDGNGQFVRFTLWKPVKHVWRFDVGRAERFDDEGIDFGATYRYYINPRLSVGGNAYTGTGEFISPEYAVGVFSEYALLPERNLLISGGYERWQSKAENSLDRLYVGATYYLDDHWIVAGVFRYDIGHPGSTVSIAGNVGFTYQVYRRWATGLEVEAGDIAYTLIAPDFPVVNYHSRMVAGHYSRYFKPDIGITARLYWVETDFWDVTGLTLTFFKEW
jgi:YaiO family outer membrane protein